MIDSAVHMFSLLGMVYPDGSLDPEDHFTLLGFPAQYIQLWNEIPDTTDIWTLVD